MNMNSGTIIINFANINVNYVNNVSAITIGKNFMCNWASTLKSNNGIGDIEGSDNLILFSQTTVIDPDYVDSPTYLTQLV